MTALLERVWQWFLRRSGMHLVHPWIEDMTVSVRSSAWNRVAT